jgi:hypothetical protein
MGREPIMGQKGSMILEYVLVSLFTLIITTALLGYLGQVFAKELAPLAKEFGVDLKVFPISFFGSG